jgi:hypothetical protein
VISCTVCDQVDVGRGAGLGAVERNHRHRPERVLAAGQVQLDVVRLDPQQAGPLAGLVPGYLGSLHVVPFRFANAAASGLGHAAKVK